MSEIDLAGRIEDAKDRASARLQELIREHKPADAARASEIACDDPEYQRLATEVFVLEELRGIRVEQWLNA
jgi:hypothetical protein